MAPIPDKISPAAKSKPPAKTTAPRPTSSASLTPPEPQDTFSKSTPLDSDVQKLRQFAGERGYPIYRGSNSNGASVYQDEASRNLPEGWRKETQPDGVNAYSNGNIELKAHVRKKERSSRVEPKKTSKPRPNPAPKVRTQPRQPVLTGKVTSGVVTSRSEKLPGVPLSPPGVNLEQDLKRARTVGKNMPDSQKFKWFYKMNRNGGPWDFKQQGRQYEDYGNFHYGAMGRAMGFSDKFILKAAGVAQARAGTSRPEWGRPNGGPPYGDDPRDQAQIRQGYEYAKKHGY